MKQQKGCFGQSDAQKNYREKMVTKLMVLHNSRFPDNNTRAERTQLYWAWVTKKNKDLFKGEESENRTS